MKTRVRLLPRKTRHLTAIIFALMLSAPPAALASRAISLCADGIFSAWCIEDDPPGACDDALHSSQTAPGSNDCDGCPNREGMPVWWVSEPYMNVRFSDEPLTYRPAAGPAVSFKLSYRQRGAAGLRDTVWPQVPGVGNGWTCSFISYLVHSPAWTCEWAAAAGGITNSVGDVIQGLECGFLRGTGLGIGAQKRWEDGANFRDGSVLISASVGSGYEVHHADGGIDVYTNAFNVSGAPFAGSVFYFLSERRDPHGLALKFVYETDDVGVKLVRVIDAMTNSTWLEYTNTAFSNQVTAVVDPSGRRVDLLYDDSGNLASITDAAGIESTFTYSSSLISLTTPYGGTTWFETGDFSGSGGFWDRADGVSRYVKVTQPDLGKHLYVYRQYGSNLVGGLWGSSPETYGLPDTLDDGDLTQRITAHWGPSQYAALSASYLQYEDPDELTDEDYSIARLRHWLGEKVTGNCSTALSCERSPAGAVTWYDYAGKTNGNDRVGSSGLPRMVAQAAGSFVRYAERNLFGSITNLIESYSLPSGSAGLRTNSFLYADNQIDLLRHIGPDGQIVSTNTWGTAPDDSGHYLLTTENALGETIQITYYYPSGRPNTISFPSGLVRTFDYDLYSWRLTAFWDTPINRTNRFSWYTSGNVQTHTNARNLAVTYYWDGLNRLTGASYPDGTTTTNLYTRLSDSENLLDVTATKDRLGHWTYFDYDTSARLIYVSNANQQVTALGYCDCGSLTAVTNALGTGVEQVTMHDYYPVTGDLWHTYLPDGTIITRTNDLLGRLYSGTVGNTTWTILYNNQGLITNVSNTLGGEEALVYDVMDHPIYVTDANGVTITNTYDAHERPSTRTYPDGGVERFGYSARGLVAHTNQLDKITYLGRDEAGRLVTVTNANNEILRYTNNAAGDLLSLTDGKNQTTRWNYDEYGRVTNTLDQAGTEILRFKYDPNDRLTNRWSVAKGNTYFSHDPLGNLTNINYPSSTDISYAYDPLNRLTNMVDAVGTTKFAYTTGGLLWTEDGPFSNDTLTNGYANRLHTSLILQQPTGTWTNGFSYDAARRLTYVTSQAGAFNYTYSYASPLPLKISLPNTSYITNTYDTVARLTGTWLKKNDQTTLNSHEYVYNSGNQRTQQVFNAGSTYNYTYDAIGQLKIADSATSSEDRGYKYDAAWNLNYRTNNTTLNTFQVNNKNELTNAPTGGTTYDANGNLTSSHGAGRSYVYDDEDRLAELYLGFQLTATEFVYDGLSRLRVRREYSYVQSFLEGDWQLDAETRYVYDGRRVIQERDGNNTPTVSYTRGNDLSGSLEGAGGIGGLLGRSHGYSSGNWSTHNFYHSDGGGNVTYLVNSSQSLAASYRYDPFGNTVSSSGSLASANVYRFSSKEVHAGSGPHSGSGLYHYGFRFYEPNLQRWLNRDPLGEWGGINLYEFVGNSPISRFDPLGLLTVHIWNQTSEAWGHASITLDDGTHISWWPGPDPEYKKTDLQIFTATAKDPQEFADDVKGEERAPDLQIHINGLDEGAINAWWRNFKKKNKWKTLSKNCSTVAGQALRKGGGAKGNWWSAHNLIWKPSDVRRFAEEIKRESDERWQRRLLELDVQPYSGPDDSGPFY